MKCSTPLLPRVEIREGGSKEQLTHSTISPVAGASQAVLPEHKTDANAAGCVQDWSDEGGPQDQRGPGLVGLPHHQELGLHRQDLPAGER